MQKSGLNRVANYPLKDQILENRGNNGAAGENRTLDLTITNGALYH